MIIEQGSNFAPGVEQGRQPILTEVSRLPAYSVSPLQRNPFMTYPGCYLSDLKTEFALEMKTDWRVDRLTVFINRKISNKLYKILITNENYKSIINTTSIILLCKGFHLKFLVRVLVYYLDAECLSHDTTYFPMSARTFESML